MERQKKSTKKLKDIENKLTAIKEYIEKIKKFQTIKNER